MIDREAFLADHTSVARPLLTADATTSWEAATTGTETALQEASRARAEVMRLYADPEPLAWLSEWRRAPSGNPLLDRQVETLFLTYSLGQQDEQSVNRLTQLESEITSLFVNHRGEYRNNPLSDNELVRILNSTNSTTDAQEAWLAIKQIGAEAAPLVRETARIRNAEAKRFGYTSHFARTMALNEIGEARLLALLEELDRLTLGPFLESKTRLDHALARRFGVTTDALRPWHYGDPFFQRPPASEELDFDGLFANADLVQLAQRTFDSVGLDVRGVLARSDLYPRPSKDQHAFCTHIDREGDVRILCNVVQSERWAETILHELGHAVYDENLGADLPWLLREPAHLILTEAIAMLFGRLRLSRDWLVDILGVPAADAGRLAAQSAERQRMAQLIFMRWALVVINFERALYTDPEQDLDALWWQLVEQFQLVTKPDARRQPDWAAKIHIALYPAYYQNYVMGELAASQISNWLTQQTGGLVGRPQAGELLRERIFSLGNRAHWERVLSAATGDPLSPAKFATEYVQAQV